MSDDIVKPRWEVYPQTMRFKVVKGMYSLEIHTSTDGTGMLWDDAVDQVRSANKAWVNSDKLMGTLV